MKHNRGMSLVEVMVVVAIVGIVLLIMIPAIAQAWASFRVNAAAQTFSNALQRARYNATSQNAVWCLEIGSFADDCNMRIFKDDNFNCTYDAGEEQILLRLEDTANITSVDFGKCKSAGNINTIAIQPDGSIYNVYVTQPASQDNEGRVVPALVLCSDIGGATTTIKLCMERFGNIRIVPIS